MFLVVTNGVLRPAVKQPWSCEQDDDCETMACHKPLIPYCIYYKCLCMERFSDRGY
ncbi:unnamed protein product [Trifolium pratense]|uniref:Uncharacterized protein n=1 Tax=Trifolium pratense TaxID=57577 RepID=A0ACB0J5I8_TRIPR|nr:unnamed protein product [Trifolium pratense]